MAPAYFMLYVKQKLPIAKLKCVMGVIAIAGFIKITKLKHNAKLETKGINYGENDYLVLPQA